MVVPATVTAEELVLMRPPVPVMLDEKVSPPETFRVFKPTKVIWPVRVDAKLLPQVIVALLSVSVLAR